MTETPPCRLSGPLRVFFCFMCGLNIAEDKTIHSWILDIDGLKFKLFSESGFQFATEKLLTIFCSLAM